MTYDEFRSGLRLLSQLQRKDLIRLQAFTEDDYQAWADFKRDPLRWLLRADDHRAAAVWCAIDRGREGRLPNTQTQTIQNREGTVIQFVPNDDHHHR
jgi:uncharacterized damage-inducible protein DinB